MITTKINNVRVKPIALPAHDESKVKGYQLFTEPYANIFIIAKKKSGKTTLIDKILRKSINKDTMVHFFVSTLFKDPKYQLMMEYLDKKGIDYNKFTSVYDDDGDNAVNAIVQRLNQKAKDEYEEKQLELEEKELEEPIVQPILINFGLEPMEDGKPKKPYVYKPKKIAPKHLFIFDDLSDELKDPAITALLKKNRHYQSRIIISSQDLKDLQPAARKQIDYYICFSKINQDRLDVIFKNAGLSIVLQQFMAAYKYATSEPYSFLYIDVNQDELRKNFSELIEFN